MTIVAYTATDRTALGALLRERATPAPGFPGNLTPAERRVVDGYITHSSPTKLAKVFGVSRWTVDQQLRSARAKAGTQTSTELVQLYINATRSQA